jgi:hypothetical protein
MKLAQLLNHRLPSSEQADHATPGKFCACHAEKQLMTFFLQRHVFFESEIGSCFEDHEDLTARIREESVDVEGGLRLIQKERIRMEEWSLRTLRLVRPPVRHPKATIFVSSEVCEDCERFKECIRNKLGVKFVLEKR